MPFADADESDRALSERALSDDVSRLSYRTQSCQKLSWLGASNVVLTLGTSSILQTLKLYAVVLRNAGIAGICQRFVIG